MMYRKRLQQLGIGEAFITVLNEKGIPTPLVHTLLTAPSSRMDIITDAEKGAVLKRSGLALKYNDEVDRESAYEMLNEKLEELQREQERLEKKEEEDAQKVRRVSRRREKSTLEKIATHSLTRMVMREVTRGNFRFFRCFYPQT